jgi:hypothetical protein
MARVRSTARVSREWDETEVTKTSPILEMMRWSRLVALARALLSLSASRACLVSLLNRFPRVPVSSCCVVGPPCQLRLPRAPPWTSMRALAHARWDPWPRRRPTHPSSFLRNLVPFRTVSLSLALCPRCSTSPETHACRASHKARQKQCQATSSFAPRWDTRFDAQFPRLCFIVGQFQLRWSSAVAVRHASVVTGRIGPIQCPRVGPWCSPRFAKASPGPSSPQTPLPAAGIPHRNNPDPPGVLPSPFSPLWPRHRSQIPTSEFAASSSSFLANFGDPRTAVARTRPNSGDITVARRSGAARS